MAAWPVEGRFELQLPIIEAHWRSPREWSKLVRIARVGYVRFGFVHLVSISIIVIGAVLSASCSVFPLPLSGESVAVVDEVAVPGRSVVAGLETLAGT